MELKAVTVTDEAGHDFAGLTLHPNPDAEKQVPVWCYIDGENGFGANSGEVSMHMLKKLDNGKFGA